MTTQEVIKLLDAGYTREEINSMIQAENVQPEEAEPAAAPEAAQAEDPMAAVTAVLEKINSKITELQAFSILNSQQPQEQGHVMTAEEALSELIRPSRTEN